MDKKSLSPGRLLVPFNKYQRMGSPLPVIWSLCTFSIGCCFLLSNLYCKSQTTVKSVEILAITKSRCNQHTNERKQTLFNLTCPLFVMLEIENERSNGQSDHVGNNLHYFKPRKEIVTHLSTEYRISGRSICLNSEVTLLIIIPSVVKDASLRVAIRETWASQIYGHHTRQDHDDCDNDLTQQQPIVKLAFFFGEIGLSELDKTILEKESDTYGDVVTIDMVDSYKNLSLKIASSLTWSVTMCPLVKYVAKVDMDTMLNIQLLLRLLDQIPFTDAIVLGHRHVFQKPLVTRAGRWAVSTDVYPMKYFPAYVYGHSYVMTRTAVDRLVYNFPYFPVIPNEDAFITGVMPLVANITKVHTATFTHLLRRQTCYDIQYGRFVSSGHKKSNLRHIWSLLKSRSCISGFIS